MKFYITTEFGFISNRDGTKKIFITYSDARHFAINHLDLSDKFLEIKMLLNEG